MSQGDPVKVAIIGGGCAAITTAFELSRPEHGGKYQVTVYQQGWRLGGKGASGRGSAGRIEEHGFHIWFGFYENAFRLMRECYAELNRDRRKCRIADWRDAFLPAPFVGFADRTANGSYRSFTSYLPPGEGLPGDPLTEHNPFTVTAYLMRAAALLRMMMLGLQRQGSDRSSGIVSDNKAFEAFGADPRQGQPAGDLQARIAQLIKLGSIATAAGLVEAVGVLEMIFRGAPSHPSQTIIGLLEAILAGARIQLEALVQDDPETALLWNAIELVLTVMLGIMRFGLLSDPRGFDAINGYEFREWMRINGCSERTLQSPLVRTCYDVAFAYENGDYERPSHGAGVGLRGSSRMLFTYRGAPFWKMRAGMGDIVFAPYYEVLKRRGVLFKFFHRLKNVKLADAAELAPGERPYLKALEFDVQAKLENDRAEYHPLVDIDGLPCWPSKPDYSQLRDGDRLEREQWDFESHWDRRKVDTKTLRVIEDFDLVVLGVGLGAIPYVARELIQRDQRWRDMVAHVKTTETQAFQIWVSENMEALGWQGPPVSLCGFAQPFESWCDMSHLVKEERWLSSRGSIVYFLSTLKDPGTPDALLDPNYPVWRREQVHKRAVDFLNQDVGHLWPKAVRSPAQFRWDILVAPDGDGSAMPPDESRFDTQYWRANVNPSDRYVLSVPGSQKYRISPLDNTYDNMTIAGDWTACGLDSGCVESAVMAGRLAAHAISSSPPLEDIIGYDHP